MSPSWNVGTRCASFGMVAVFLTPPRTMNGIPVATSVSMSGAGPFGIANESNASHIPSPERKPMLSAAQLKRCVVRLSVSANEKACVAGLKPPTAGHTV